MIFRPNPDQFRMGDFWLFENQGIVHQYYLKRHVDGRFNLIGHITSEDLLNWQEHEDIILIPTEDDWDFPGTSYRTGYTIKHDNRYWMAFGAMPAGIEEVGWLVSDDLHNWERLGSGPAMWPQSQWYEHEASQTIEFGCFWRDPHIIRVGDVWETFLCARTKEGPHGGRGCIGRARSQDLQHWQYLPPIFAPGRYRGMEVPHHFEFQNHHYFLWSTMSRKGIRLPSPKGQLSAGVYYCMSERYEGPYKIPPDHLLLGENAYVGRHFTLAGEDLFVHLNQREYDEEADRPTFALPKRLGQLPDKSLYLQYWPGAASLWHEQDQITLVQSMEMMGLPGEWRLTANAVSGECEFGPSAIWVNVDCQDFHLACDLSLTGNSRGSILLRGQANEGLIVTINTSERQFEIGTATGVRSGLYLRLVDTVPFAAVPALKKRVRNGRLSLRLIARAEIVEVYADDCLIFTRSFANLPQEGRLGFAIDTGRIQIEHLRINPILHSSMNSLS